MNENKMKIPIIIVSLFFSYLSCFAQGEWNQWRFGQNISLDFNSGNPVQVANNNMNTGEGTISLADSLGNLLFYSDGKAIWDKTNIVMPNGYGLHGTWQPFKPA
ncbi:MAG: hypothetical protein WCK63_17845, partial [Betaproteobacteria bacterium]